MIYTSKQSTSRNRRQNQFNFLVKFNLNLNLVKLNDIAVMKMRYSIEPRDLKRNYIQKKNLDEPNNEISKDIYTYIYTHIYIHIYIYMYIYYTYIIYVIFEQIN